MFCAFGRIVRQRPIAAAVRSATAGITAICFATVRGSATFGSAARRRGALAGFCAALRDHQDRPRVRFRSVGAAAAAEGTTYVVRATDFRGILMRVVVDARSGALRAVNRIVPGPAPYGVVGMMTPPYGPSPYGPLPYGPYGPPGYGPPPYGPPPYGPADIGDPEMGPTEVDLSMPPPSSAPSTIYPGAHSLAP